MKHKRTFKNFGNIGLSVSAIGPWMADISVSVSASRKPYRSISNNKYVNLKKRQLSGVSYRLGSLKK